MWLSTFVGLHVFLSLTTSTAASRLNSPRGHSRLRTIPLPHQPFHHLSGKESYQDTARNVQSRYPSWALSDRRDLPVRSSPPSARDGKKPNIILILTDDQDIELGSMNFMPKTLRILGEGGAHFPNAYVTTPMCCPSRSSLLTGLYVHNHNVYTNNDNCSSPMWQQEHETKTFANFLNNAGYRTAYFGKYLNEYNGSYVPPGWREWAGLIRNSRFYNYTVNINGNKVKHGDNYYKDYYPDLIANDSIAFLQRSKQYFVNKPVLMVLSFPSPHGPEDAAPQYQNLFFNITTHRTPSWNYAPNPDKQWLLRYTNKMEPIHVKFTDVLHTKRLQTLQSVDNAVEKLYNELKNLGELNNTYIFYTSDHGYHLGQFGLVKGKSMPFEFDVRVPFYVRGPRVPRGVRIQDIALNLDIAPTFLDIAGVKVPDYVDGKSLLPLLNDAYEWVSAGHTHGEVQRTSAWRDSFLIERGKITKEYYQSENVFAKRISKDQRLAKECQKPEYASPCKPYQRWECIHDGARWRIRKCRGPLHAAHSKQGCHCPESSFNEQDFFLGVTVEAKQSPELHITSSGAHGNIRHQSRLDPLERRLQRRFLKEHIGKDIKPVFIGSRPKRSLSSEDKDFTFDVEGVLRLTRLLDITVGTSAVAVDSSSTSNITTLLGNAGFPADEYDFHKVLNKRFVPTSVAASGHSNNAALEAIASGCIIHANQSVTCQDEIYQNIQVWRDKKERLDMLIKKLQTKLEELKGIRRHLKQRRPPDWHTKSSDFLGSESFGDELFPSQKGCHCDVSQNDNRFIQQVAPPKPREDKRTREERLKKKERKLRRRTKYENTTCNVEKMNCFTHDNDHWKTAPFWTYGPFCFCQNSNNNTFWCLRTINETHNFLYCEYITGFITYYDLRVDPYQLRNAVFELDYPTLEELRRHLNKLKACKGARDCSSRFDQNNIGENTLSALSDGTRQDGPETSSML